MIKNKASFSLPDMECAWKILNEKFPFTGYIRPARKSGYFEMVRKVVKWSGLNAKVLDFGAGPCDKTAMFSLAGMEVMAFDNLQDAWHKLNGNKEKILAFAKSVGIDYYLPNGNDYFTFPDKQYDVMMMHNVIEHLHSSPRSLLNKLLTYIRPGGILAITVPNAANLRKRLYLLLGKTNYSRFPYFYWYPGQWHGHVREYVRKDLLLLNEYLRMDLLELTTYHLQLDALLPFFRKPFIGFSWFFPGIRDSWILVCRKPLDWKPQFEPSGEQFEKAFGNQYYDYSKDDFVWED